MAAVTSPLDIWDMHAIVNDPLEVQVLSERVVETERGAVLERELTYRSEISRGEEIRIAAHLAMPVGEGTLPGLVIGHGHGGHGSMDMAQAYALTHKVIAVSIDGPGQGGSSGPRDCMGHWLDVLETPRHSYLYHCAVAGMRAVTYLRTLAECDPKRIGVTGGSMGGIMTLLVNGVDKRLACAVDNAACGAWATGAREGSWLRTLMMDGMGLAPDSAEVTTLFRYLDPVHYIPTQRSPLLIILGAQDEYFPITSLAETVAGLRGPHRLTYIADWDHGLYTIDNPALQTYDNSAAAALRVNSSSKRWFDYYLHGKGEAIPRGPVLRMRAAGGAVLARATVDEGSPVSAVRFCYSTDGAYTFTVLPMERGGGMWEARMRLGAAQAEGLAAFVEVEYEDGLFLSSRPYLGPQFRLRVRPAPFNEGTFVMERSDESAIHYLERLKVDETLSLQDRLWQEARLAVLWANLKRYDKALEIYNRVLEQAPQPPIDDIVPVVLWRMAEVLDRAGRRAEAVEVLERALATWPDTPEAEAREIAQAEALLERLRGK